MSSTILHIDSMPPRAPLPPARSRTPAVDAAAAAGAAHGPTAARHPFLTGLGERVRDVRARQGLTRKALSERAGVSERHLANLENGSGNASALVLAQVSQALQCPLAELFGDLTTRSPEWLLLRELLQDADEALLRRVREAVGELLGSGGARGQAPSRRSARVALIGLRGAGKSTLGRVLARDLGFPYVELGREIEKFAGCSVSEIQSLYGQSAYRRYERRALEETIQTHPEAVIATPGGLVSDAATFNLLLAHCTTVWLRASPEDHLRRVAAQGDMRPMAGNKEALNDLKLILAGREPFYSTAEFHLDTSAAPLDATFQALRRLVRDAIKANAL